MKKFLKVIAWMCSILIIICGLAYMSQSIIAGVMSIFGGVLILPPVYKLIKKKEAKYNKKIAVIMCAGFCFVSFCIFGVRANEKNKVVSTLSNDVATINVSNESNIENNIVNNEVEITKANNSINNIVNDNNTETSNIATASNNVLNKSEEHTSIENVKAAKTTENDSKIDSMTAKDKSKSSSSSSLENAEKTTTGTHDSTENSETVYITSKGKKFHRAGCRYLKNSSEAISRSSAISSGYSPCSVCNP